MSISENKIAAFFDFDRTLIDVNSGLLFAKYEHRHKHISHFQFIKSFYWGILYHFNLVDIDKAYGEVVRIYKGKHTDYLNQLTIDWFLEEVKEHIQPGAMKCMKFHKDAGHKVVLATNSSCYLSQIVTDTWKFDGWVANYFPLDENGIVTGELDLPLCYGKGKLLKSEKWAKESGISLKDSYFYTDAVSDLPMLEAVKHPIVINPDPMLKRIAQKRSWEIQDWT